MGIRGALTGDSALVPGRPAFWNDAEVVQRKRSASVDVDGGRMMMMWQRWDVQRSILLRPSAACDYGGRSRPLASLARKARYRSGRASR